MRYSLRVEVWVGENLLKHERTMAVWEGERGARG
jgi:hypothetical protein